jgi:predicted PurR-regulated permease PerM
MKLLSRKSQPDSKIEITIATKTIVRIMLIVLLTILVLAAINKISSALILIFLAFFLALALNGPVHWIALHLPGKRRGNRSVATTISFLIVIGLLIAFIAAFVPPAVGQTASFVNNVPNLVRDAGEQDTPIGRFIRQNNFEEGVTSFSQDISGVLKSSGSRALSTVSTVGASLVSLFTVLALTFMMLVEGPSWVHLSRRLMPADHREHIIDLTREMYRVVRGYVNGQITLAAIAAILIWYRRRRRCGHWRGCRHRSVRHRR